MTEAEVLDLLQEVGAFRAGHFVYTSGLHGDTYVNKDALYPHAKETSRLCRAMAEAFKGEGVEAIIGPAVAAAVLSQWTAYHLSEIEGREVLATYADKDGPSAFLVKRGYDKLIAGKKTLVVEDLTTTGGSIRKVVEAARGAGAEIVGAIAICNRGGVTAQALGVPRFQELVSLSLEQWPAPSCELCQRGIPINTDLGHGRAFLADKNS